MKKTQKPRVSLKEKLEASRLQGYAQGFRQAQIDLETKRKAFENDIYARRFDAKLKLINAAGQAFAAIASAMSDDSAAGKGL